MAKIPLGNFGMVAPQAAPGADTSEIGRAVQGLGHAIGNVGEVLQQQRLALARAKAVNATLDDRNAVADVAKSVTDRLDSGELEYDDAQAVFAKEVGKLKGPDLSGLDRVTAENVQHAVKVTRDNAARAIDSVSDKLRAGDVARQTGSAFDKLATASTFPGADSHGLLQQAQLLADAARHAGVPQESIASGLDRLHAAVATSDATRNPQVALTKLAQPQSGDPTYDALTYESRLKVTEHAKSQLVNHAVAGVMGRFESEGPDAGMAALASAEHVIGDPELRDDLRSRVNAQIGQLRTQRRMEHADAIVKLERDLATNSAGRGARKLAEDLYELGALTPAELAGYHSAIDQDTLQRADQDAALVTFRESIVQGVPLDPKNPDHRKYLEQSFAADTRQYPARSGEWQAIALSYAGQTRMLPTQASAWLRTAARSPDAGLAATAAGFFGSLEEKAPEAIGDLDPDTRTFLAQLNGMTEAGTDREKAFETVRANVFETRRDVVELRTKAYGELAKQSDQALTEYVDRDLDTAFSEQPEASVLLRGDFESQARAYFLKTGDIGLARDLAWRDLRRVYGTTEVNGTRMVSAFPIEQFGVTPAEARADVAQHLLASGQQISVDDVLMVPDGLTLRAVYDALTGQAVQPSYRLVTKSGDLVLGADGIPMRYALPSGDELVRRFQERQALGQADARAAIDEAKVLREQLRAAEKYRQGPK